MGESERNGAVKKLLNALGFTEKEIVRVEFALEYAENYPRYPGTSDHDSLLLIAKLAGATRDYEAAYIQTEDKAVALSQSLRKTEDALETERAKQAAAKPATAAKAKE